MKAFVKTVVADPYLANIPAVVQDHLGWQLNDLEILTFECNKDYHGVRIDGVQCVTKTETT